MRRLAVALAGLCLLGFLAVPVTGELAWTAQRNAIDASFQRAAAEHVPDTALAPLARQWSSLKAGLHVNPLDSRPRLIAARLSEVQASRVADSRAAATRALADLEQVAGRADPAARERLNAARDANTYDSLAAEFTVAMQALTADADLAPLWGQLKERLDAETQMGFASLTPGPDRAGYDSLPPAERVARHAALLAALHAAIEASTARVATVKTAQADLAAMHSESDLLRSLGENVGAADAQLAALDGQLASATTAETATAVESALPKLRDAYSGAAWGAPAGFDDKRCLKGAPPKLIVVSLGAQELVAYRDGCPFLTTLVTTGQKALRSTPGVWNVIFKASPFQFISPWPVGSPYYYAPEWSQYAIEFNPDGSFLHDAAWQAEGTYGFGSENTQWASHGCVHVQMGPLRTIYGWVDEGTEVILLGPQN